MSRTLLFVEDVFTTRGSGVLVAPRVTLDPSLPASFPVTLRLPTGEERSATAVFEVSHIRGASAPFAMVRLLDLTPEDVPIGTIVVTTT